MAHYINDRLKVGPQRAKRTIGPCEKCHQEKEIVSRGLCDTCRKERDAMVDAWVQEIPSAKVRKAKSTTTKDLFNLLSVVQRLGFNAEEIEVIFLEMAQRHVNVRPIRKVLAFMLSVKEDDEQYGDEDEDHEDECGSGSD